ncbi:uncharacterized protein BJ171DRAFT_459923 [Polychytrium aggregatum]|uniref:uncharacterized protein n=1 Tax=Polychytrium aggregatum TaxID=110093 RepID=UPI0022FF11D8|nr:uncharacterized protein BJ171DRAFT_459923 [Polychytrium aggregatum]KAI9203814.1 hypothetical protein BJ171DRAFT_459923 [Polychytrium aggregatum]
MQSMTQNNLPQSETPAQASEVSHIEALLPDLGLEVESTKLYKWQINNWSSLNQSDRVHSPEFECGGSHWRVLLFPKGNRTPDSLSVFLESVEAQTIQKPTKWHVCANFALAIANADDDTIIKSSHVQHRFSPSEQDWGFNTLVKQSLLFQPIENFSRPIIEQDRVVIIVYMQIIKDSTGVLWHNFVDYDSKEETGYVGLKNQGATCYMNSLLQSLYFTNEFRKATFQIPTENDDPNKSTALALQRVFYNLQYSSECVGTIELTKSFGWDMHDSFMQHDVQEFNRVLQDNLESKMKGTAAEGAISRLFVGKMKSYIKCINVEYESSRTEDYYDIQLNVKGCKNLTESFREYVTVETLEGENKYMAEGHGLQDAKKGVIFNSFPPVLHLQLKRFEYDMMKDMMVKINDRHEFPETIELDEFLDQSSAPGPKQTYALHGVLVHTGDLHGGHYCAFLKPEKNGKWFKFDDDRVTPVSNREVFEDNFGGIPDANPQFKSQFRSARHSSNAYMLVYIRLDDIDHILAPISEHDIPSHVGDAIQREREKLDLHKKELEERHLYLTFKVINDDAIRKHHGFDLWNFEEADYLDSEIFSGRIKKDQPVHKFKALVAERFRIPPEQIRLWSMAPRQNKTVRPDMPITEGDDENHTMEQIRDKFAKGSHELRFYLEQPDSALQGVSGGQASFFMPKDENTPAGYFMIFLKYYDPFKARMEFITKLSVKNRESRVTDVISIVSNAMELPSGTPLRIYEEVKPNMIELIKIKSTFKSAEIGDGDILCLQPDLTPQEIERLPDPSLATVPAYFDSLFNQITVLFRERQNKDGKSDIQLQLSRKMPYNVVATKLAEVLRVDPLHLRFYQTDGIRAPIKHQNILLQEMLPASFQHVGYNNSGYFGGGYAHPILAYEILDVAITEFETKRIVKLTLVDQHQHETGPVDVLIPKEASIKDLVLTFAAKANVDLSHISKPLVFENLFGKYGTTYTLDQPVSKIPDQIPLYLEDTSVLDEVGPDDVVIKGLHLSKELNRSHGLPFHFVCKKGLMAAGVKKSLQERVGLNDKEFAKVKLFHVQASQVKPIEDGDILSDLFINELDYLGLDHPDRSAKTFSYEKAIKIHN